MIFFLKHNTDYPVEIKTIYKTILTAYFHFWIGEKYPKVSPDR